MKSSAATSALSLLNPSCSVTIFSPQSLQWPLKTPIFSLSPQDPNLSSHRRRPILWTRYRRRDSNAGDVDEDKDDDEDFGGERRRRWWSDNSPSEMDQEPGILEEFLDGIWIFKVFGSYYPLLPAFLLSMLLATGPKAFLMSLALPIGQSAFTLAFKKLWGNKKQNNPRKRSKTNSKRKARVNTAVNLRFEEEEEEEEESKGTQKRKMGYRSWVGRDDDVSVNEGNQNPSTFGGWDDLDRTKEFDVKDYSKRSAVKGKVSPTREKNSEMPLLLRLLIAVFPFFGSWTKIL